MTASQDHLHGFRHWLDTPSTYAFLLRFVEAKRRYKDSTSTMTTQETDDLCQEFLLYLFDRFLADSRLSPELLLLIHTVQFHRILDLAWGRFIWQCREVTRNKQHNPRGYLYRRLREILQHNKQHFVVIRNQQGHPYYCPANRIAAQLPTLSPPEEGFPGELRHWPPPLPEPGQTPEQYLFSTKWLLDAADFFWQQAVSRKSTAIAIPVRDLCSYLAGHHPWLNKPQRKEGSDSDYTEQLVDEREGPEEHALRIDALQSIGLLAVQLVGTWPTDQQQVFALRLADPPVTYEAIAERLGLTDHNRAYALNRKAVQSLRHFTSTWPGPPLAELPREIAQTFIEEMKRLCKNSLASP